MNTCRTLALGAVTTGALGLIAMAAPQGGGNTLITLQPNTPALASDVNANFQANRSVANAAQMEAAQASADAANALNTANGAQSTASSAQSTASMALQSANMAATDAASASSAASSAQAAADAAQTTANTALADAASAQSSANAALAATQGLDMIAVDPFGNFGLGTMMPDPDFGLNVENLGVGNSWSGSIAAGSSTGHKVVLGDLNGIATIGAHNGSLNAWADLAINPTGNVGIGTTAPIADSKLHVEGRVRIDTGLSVDPSAEWVDEDFRIQDSDAQFALYSNTSGGSSGNFAMKMVDSTTGTLVDVWEIQKANTQQLQFKFGTNPVAGSNPTVMALTGNGRMGIGTTSPAEVLHVAGNVRCVTLIQTSDARLKTDVEDLDDALATVRALRGVSYEWDLDQVPHAEDGRQVGFLAQEVRAVLPEAVREDDQGQLAVAYTQVVPVLCEAVQELEGIVHSKDAEIDELRAEVEHLRSVTERVEALESALSEVLATR